MIQAILLFSGLSFLITAVVLYPIISGAKKYNLTDVPEERKVHKQPIPVLGGIGIFLGMATATAFATGQFDLAEYIPAGAAVAILFMLGLLDDVKNISARLRLFVQFSLATGLYFAGYQMTGFYGWLGLGEQPLFITLPLTVLAVTVIINAYNLIDGVNGLAGILGAVGSIMFGILFWYLNEQTLSLMAFIFSGALIGFLTHNFGKAKVFMGDSGSTVLGLVMALFFIKLINAPAPGGGDFSMLPIGLSIICVPVFDLFRVFFFRLSSGKSFFYPDQNHIHHLLLDIGKGHSWIAVFLGIFAVSNTAFTVFFGDTISVFAATVFPMLFLLGLVFLSRLSKSISTLKSSEFARHQTGYFMPR